MSEHQDRPSRRTVLGAAAGVVAGATTVTAAPAAAAPEALADESARASARGIECVADLR